MTYPNTESWKTIEEYLESNMDAIEEADNVAVRPYIMPIFMADITNDPKVMMQFHRWLDSHVSADLRYIVSENIDMLSETNLNLYKIKVILGMRGPTDEDMVIAFTKANLNNSTVKELGKHKDFPQKAKDILYDTYEYIEYLPQEAQDIFIF